MAHTFSEYSFNPITWASELDDLQHITFQEAEQPAPSKHGIALEEQLQPRQKSHVHFDEPPKETMEWNEGFPLNRTVSSVHNWRVLQDRVKNFILFDGEEKSDCPDIASEGLFSRHTTQFAAEISNASFASDATSVDLDALPERIDSFIGDEGPDTLDVEVEVSSKLTTILFQAEAAARTVMHQMYTNITNICWLQFQALGTMIATGHHALSWMALFLPLSRLHRDEEKERLKVMGLQHSAFLTMSWYSLADREHLFRRLIIAQQSASYSNISDEHEIGLDMLRNGILCTYLEWKRRTESACKVQFWYRRMRLRQKLTQISENDWEARQCILTALRFTVRKHEGSMMPAYKDFETYQETMQDTSPPTICPEHSEAQTKATPGRSSKVDAIRMLRRHQVARVQQEVSELKEQNATLEASIAQLRKKQQKVNTQAQEMTWDISDLQDKLVKQKAALLAAEANLKGMQDYTSEINHLRGDNATLEFLIRKIESQDQEYTDYIHHVERKLRQSKEAKQRRLANTLQSAQRHKIRLKRSCTQLQRELNAAQGSAQHLQGERNAMAANRKEGEEVLSERKLALEAERDCLISQVKKKEKALQRMQVGECFPDFALLGTMSHKELWTTSRELHLLHNHVCSILCGKTLCFKCKDNKAATILLPCEHPGLCLHCAMDGLPLACNTCLAPVTALREVLIT